MSSSSFPSAASSVVDAFSPCAPLSLSWGEVSPAEGAQLSPAAVARVPALRLAGEDAASCAGKLYTVILSDPDAPNAAEPKFAEWLHWLQCNASAEDLAGTGEALVAYFGSAPGNGAGVHRYCIVVYEQPAGAIGGDEPRIPLHCGFAPRRSFNSRAFAARHGLRPVAAFTYCAEWDESVPELHKLILPVE